MKRYDECQRIAAEVAACEMDPRLFCDECKVRAAEGERTGLAYEICDDCFERCRGARKAGAS